MIRRLFYCNTSCFKRFKVRFHNIRVSGKAMNADEEGVLKIFESLIEVITYEGTVKQQMDERGLFWRRMPACTNNQTECNRMSHSLTLLLED